MYDINSFLSWAKPYFGPENPSPMMPRVAEPEESATYDPSMWDKLLGWQGKDGIAHAGMAMPLLQGAGALGNLFMGMKQYGLGKDMLRENRRQFDADYNNQRTLVNSQLEDRQRARVASNPGAYESVGAYMDKNRIR